MGKPIIWTKENHAMMRRYYGKDPHERIGVRLAPRRFAAACGLLLLLLLGGAASSQTPSTNGSEDSAGESHVPCASDEGLKIVDASGDTTGPYRAFDEGGMEVVRVVDGCGNIIFEYSMQEWHAWAREHLNEAIGGPLRIDPWTVRPEDFTRFRWGPLSPDQSKLLVMVEETKQIPQSLHVVGVLDLQTHEFRAVDEVAWGFVDDKRWSPDGKHFAYALNDAGGWRAAEEGLRIDDLESMEPLRELEAYDLLEVAYNQSKESLASYIPVAIKDMRWISERTIRFTTNDPTRRYEPLPMEGTWLWEWNVIEEKRPTLLDTDAGEL